MKKLPWVLAGIFLAIIVCLFLLLLNAGIALDNARTQAAFLRERCNLALLILRKDWIGSDTARVAKLSSDLKKQGTVVSAGNENFNIGDILFTTMDGKIKDVQYFK